ncbi:MAG: hypothetical protein AB8G96_05990 [Phycisphaerales bacterium]
MSHAPQQSDEARNPASRRPTGFRTSDPARPAQPYVRMTRLEMERQRLRVERDAAMSTVRRCDARSRAIDLQLQAINLEIRRHRGAGGQGPAPRHSILEIAAEHPASE